MTSSPAMSKTVPEKKADTKPPKHINNGACPKCEEIFSRFKGFHAGLRGWFVALQAQHPDAHIACAGRGHKDQETFFRNKASKARYGQSAHNYNAAIDLFQLTETGAASWGRSWFDAVISPAVESHNAVAAQSFRLLWYGRKGAPFFELPHIEVANWRSLNLPLVEPHPDAPKKNK